MAFIRPAIALGLLAAVTTAEAGHEVRVQIRDAAGAPVPGAVVYLESGPPATAKPGTRVVIDQRDKVFVPQVTVVQVGTEVAFPNSDSVSHHVYSFARPNAFELPLYKGGTRPNVRFDHAGVVALGCNIHDSMIAYVVVVETPYFAQADGQGTATIGGVEAGSYAVQVWSPRLDPAKPLAAGTLGVGASPVQQRVAVNRKLRGEPAAGGGLVAGEY
jgi:plastocyanin